MSRISILKHSISTVVAGLLFVGLLSPANAAYPHDAASVFPDLPIGATADHASTVLTSHLPWLAPVGIGNRIEPTSPNTRPCRHGNVQSDQELDRKLIICRGCWRGWRTDHSRAE